MSRLLILILAYITTFELYAQDMANNIDQEEVDYWVEQILQCKLSSGQDSCHIQDGYEK